MSAISYIKECIVEQMNDMTLERKLDFLTDIFLLTEDIRHAISFPNENLDEVQTEEHLAVDSSFFTYENSDCLGESGSDEDNADPCSDEAIRSELMSKSKEFLVSEVLFQNERREKAEKQLTGQ